MSENSSIGEIAVIASVGVAMVIVISWIGLTIARPQKIYNEETSRIVEQQSARRIEGVNSNISNLCMQIKTNKDFDFKKALSEQLMQDASKIDAKFITQPNQICISQSELIIQGN